MLWIVLTQVGLAADPFEVVGAQLHKENFEKAREKCVKFEAAEARAAEYQNLREACSEAYEPLARAAATSEAWRSFRKTWVGTPLAEKAYATEAELGLKELGDMASEDAYLQYASKYAKVEAVAQEARGMAIVAAFRDVKDDREALEVVNRYPQAKQVNQVLLRHLGPFVTIEREPKGLMARFRAVVLLGANLPEPTIGWALKQGEGAVPFKEGVHAVAKQWGFPEGWLSAVATQPFGFEAEVPMIEVELGGAKVVRRRYPEFPLCWGEGLGELGARVTLGTGEVFEPTPWADGCGPDAKKALLISDANGVAGLLDPSGAWRDLRDHQALFTPATIGSIAADGEGRTTTTLSGLPEGLGARPEMLRAAPGSLWAKGVDGWSVLDLPSLSRSFTSGDLPPLSVDVPLDVGTPLGGDVLSGTKVDGVEISAGKQLDPMVYRLLGWSGLFPDEAGTARLERLAAGHHGSKRIEITTWKTVGANDFAPEMPKDGKVLPIREGAQQDLAMLGVDGLVIEKSFAVDLGGLPGDEVLHFVVLPNGEASAEPAEPAEEGAEAPPTSEAPPAPGTRMLVVVGEANSVQIAWPLAIDDTSTRGEPFAFTLDEQPYVAWPARTTGQIQVPYLEVVRPVAGGYALDTYARPITLP